MNSFKGVLMLLLITIVTSASAVVTFRPIGSSYNTLKIRYIRDYVDANIVNDYSHWIEIQAYTTSGTNVALNKTVKAYRTATNEEFTLTNNVTQAGGNDLVTDGKTGNDLYPTTKGTDYNAYVVVDLGELHLIAYLKIFHYYDNNVINSRAYYGTKTQVSTDGITWITVFDSQSSYGNITTNMYRESSSGRTIYIADKISRNDNITVLNSNDRITFPKITEQVTVDGNTYTFANFHREGYVFNGWNTKPDGSGTRIAAGTKAIPTQNIYYADWTPAACTLTLNPNATEGTEAIRYIRDYANGNTINDINHWIEIKAYNSNGKNVAFNKTVKAYTAEGTEITIANIDKIVDGDTTNTAYADAGTYNNSYVVVDLGSPQQVAYLKIFHFWNNALPRAYYGTKTEVSADGINWHTVFDSKSVNGTIGGKMYRETHMGHTIYLGNNASTNGLDKISVPQGGLFVYDAYETFNGRKLPTFTREGFALNGWNTKADGSGTAYPATLSVDASVLGNNSTLYAQWRSYLLSINPNGGTYDTKSDLQNIDVVSLPMPINFPKHLTKIFKCWSGSGEKYLSNYQNIPCSSSNETTFNGTESYTIVNGSDYRFNDKFTVNAWAYIEKWTDKATRLRINVDALNNGFDIVLNAQTTNLRFEYYGNEKRIFTTNKESNTLTDGWHQFTLTYDGAVLRGYIDAIEVFNSTRSVTSTTASVHGTPFNGKLKNVSILHHAMTPSEIINQYNYPNTAYYFCADIDANLKAEWEEGYTIIYNANGGAGTMSSVSCQPDQTYTLSVNAFTRRHHTFTGWNTQYDDSGDAYTDKQAITNLVDPGNTITLYAQWQVSSKALTINPNGGLYKGSSDIHHELIDSPTLIIEQPTHDSKSFLGWSGTAEPFISNCQNFTSSSFEEVTFDGSTAISLKPYIANYNYDKFTANVWVFNEDWSTFTTSINNTNSSLISCMQSGGWKIYASNGGAYIGFQCTTKAGEQTALINNSNEGAKMWKDLEAGWHMLTLVFDGTNMTGYLDGQQYCTPIAISGNIAPNYEATIMAIGGDPNSTGTIENNSYFKGKMKNVSIMNYAMTPEEVDRQYKNPNTTYYFFRDKEETLTANWTIRRAVSINTNGGTYKNETGTITETITAIPQEVFHPTKNGSAFYGWNGTGEKYLSNHQSFKTSADDEVNFDGTTAVSLKPYIANYNYQKFTANVWVFNEDWSTFTTSINNTNSSLISCMQSGGWKIYASNGGAYIGFQVSTKTAASVATINKASAGARTWASLEPGWHMLTLVYTGTKLTAYLDGNQYCDTVAVSGNIAPNYDATIMAIGGDPNSTGTIEDNTYFKGKMKNVGIMNYAMTPEEVRLQYQNPNIAYYFYPGSTLTLAAMWQTGYTVVYNANGGTGLMNNQPCTTGQTYVTTANQFVREGYKFAGWNTEANGTGTAYAVGQSFTNLAVNGATATLYAQWTALPYTITYDYNDGTSPQTATYYANNNLSLAAAPIRGNYTFETWLVTSADEGTWKWGNSYTAGQNVGQNQYGNVQLTALWKKTPTTTEYTMGNNIFALQEGSVLRFYGIPSGTTKVQLYDLAGRCIRYCTINDNTLNISEIESGIYLCTINQQTLKIIIRK